MTDHFRQQPRRHREPARPSLDEGEPSAGHDGGTGRLAGREAESGQPVLRPVPISQCAMQAPVPVESLRLAGHIPAGQQPETGARIRLSRHSQEVETYKFIR